MISLNRRSDLRSFTKLITARVSCISGKPSCRVKGIESQHEPQDTWDPPPNRAGPPRRLRVPSGPAAHACRTRPLWAGPRNPGPSQLELCPRKYFFFGFSAKLECRVLTTPGSRATCSQQINHSNPTNHHPGSHKGEPASFEWGEKKKHTHIHRHCHCPYLE